MIKGKHQRAQEKKKTFLMTLGCNENAVNEEGWDKKLLPT